MNSAVSVPTFASVPDTHRAAAVLITADDVNREHRLVRQGVENAVGHAIRCGDLLLMKKGELKHGEFMDWIEANCEFPQSTASIYIKAAQQNSNGLEISALRRLWGPGHGALHRTDTSGNQEWYTPAEYIEAARAAMGGIDLDPASSAVAQETVKAREFLTKESDALSCVWRGRVFLNPPYSQPECGKFIEKLCREITEGRVSEAVLLVNNCTETLWFQRAASLASRICFPAKRISYISPSGETVGSPTQGQAFLYFGKRTRPFQKRFVDIGLIVATV